MTKSHVAMTFHTCPMCGKYNDESSEILLDTRLENTLEPRINVGLKAHEACKKEGYICFVEVLKQDEKSINIGRTGHIAEHIINDLDKLTKEFLEEKGFLCIAPNSLSFLLSNQEEEE